MAKVKVYDHLIFIYLSLIQMKTLPMLSPLVVMQKGSPMKVVNFLDKATLALWGIASPGWDPIK